jgi:hypothetical protein
MATQPHPEPPKPAPPPPKPPEDPQDKTAATKAELELQKKQAGEPVKTIADEQRERSEEMEKEGVDKWMSKFDQRAPEERRQQIKGVIAKAS